MVMISVDVFGEKELARKLLRFGEAANDMRPVGVAFMHYMRSTERTLFDSEGASGQHGRWKPLKDATVAYKQLGGLDPRILRAYGDLFASMTGRGEGHVEKISADEWFFGTRVPYAKYHQSTKPRRRLPRRPVIDLNENDKRHIVKLVQAHLIKAQRRW